MVLVSDLKLAISEKEEEIRLKFKNENIVERDLLTKVKAPKKDFATVITGPRRSGKSIFAFQLAGKENFGYVNFEDERLRISAGDLNKVLDALYGLKGDIELLIFDEIQNIDGWEPFVSRLLGSKKVVLTGSNAKIMSKELATRLTGRHLDYELFPFDFKEFLEFKSYKINEQDFYLTRERAKLTEFAEKYVKEGGFPLALREGKTVLAELYNDIIEKDVVQRYKINMRTKLAELSRYLVSNTSSEISYRKLKNIFGIKGQHTIQDWISYLEKAYLLFIVERFSFKLKEAIMAPKKIYCIDTGIIGVISREQGISRLMENTVAVDLLRRKTYSDIEVNYWKNYAQKEVDFVLRKGRKVFSLIQVTYASSSIDIKDREINGLLIASKELRCNDLLVITWDYEAEERVKGRKIKFVPLWKWLLNI
jgi:predicted AAA+ superfamily ATPase